MILGAALLLLAMRAPTGDLGELQRRAYGGELLEVVAELASRPGSSVEELRLLAYLQSSIGDEQGSFETLDRVLERAPDDLDARLRQADCRWAAGRLEEARTAYRGLAQILEQSPGQADEALHARVESSLAALEVQVEEVRTLRVTLGRLRLWTRVALLTLVIAVAALLLPWPVPRRAA